MSDEVRVMTAEGKSTPPAQCRMVQVVDGDGRLRAAIVTDDPDEKGEFGVAVLGAPAQNVEGATTSYRRVSHEDQTGKVVGSWRWPPRVG